MGNCSCCTPNDFEFKVENGKVALHQPLPVPFTKLVQNEQLLIRLLTANGVQNIKNIETKASVWGGQSGQNRVIKINFTDSTPSKKVLIKGSLGNADSFKTQTIREAWFYERVAPALYKNGVYAPKSLLNIYDTQTCRHFVFMELLDGCTDIGNLGIEEYYDCLVKVDKEARAKAPKVDMQVLWDQMAD